MDMGTIETRLQRKQPQHPADVYADIRQILHTLVIFLDVPKMHLCEPAQGTGHRQKAPIQKVPKRAGASLVRCHITVLQGMRWRALHACAHTTYN